MMAGNGRLGDLKCIVLHSADGGFVHLQFMCAAGHARAQENQFRHICESGKAIISTGRFKSNGKVGSKGQCFAFAPEAHALAMSSRNSAKSGVESCGPGEASGWYCTQKIGFFLWCMPSTV